MGQSIPVKYHEFGVVPKHSLDAEWMRADYLWRRLVKQLIETMLQMPRNLFCTNWKTGLKDGID